MEILKRILKIVTFLGWLVITCTLIVPTISYILVGKWYGLEQILERIDLMKSSSNHTPTPTRLKKGMFKMSSKGIIKSLSKPLE